MAGWWGDGVEPGAEVGLARAGVLARKKLHEGVLGYMGSGVVVLEQTRSQVKHLVQPGGSPPIIVMLRGVKHLAQY
jgi:hypothetical protein